MKDVEKLTNKNITLEAFDSENWRRICDISVSGEQKVFFPEPNVYLIAVSRYEEGDSKFFFIKANNEYVGFITSGYDEDGVTGYIGQIIIDHRYQRNGYGKQALILMIEHLQSNLGVNKININNSKHNYVSGKLFEELGFKIYEETEEGQHRQLDLLVNNQ